jgi:hypothetical protein
MCFWPVFVSSSLPSSYVVQGFQPRAPRRCSSSRKSVQSASFNIKNPWRKKYPFAQNPAPGRRSAPLAGEGGLGCRGCSLVRLRPSIHEIAVWMRKRDIWAAVQTRTAASHPVRVHDGVPPMCPYFMLPAFVILPRVRLCHACGPTKQPHCVVQKAPFSMGHSLKPLHVYGVRF